VFVHKAETIGVCDVFTEMCDVFIGALLAAPGAARCENGSDPMRAVRATLPNYGRFLDSRDLASYACLFAKDGESEKAVPRGFERKRK